jgi:FAD/FMN-containing dehydrogenase
MQKLDAFLEHVMSEEIVADGTVAENQTQITNLWSCREGIAETLNHWGGVYKYDLSLPLPQLYSLVEATRARMLEAGLLGEDESHPVVDVIGYGHMGDSNLHLNVPVRKFTKEVEKLLEPWIYEQVQEMKGSISAEHGLGIAKKDFIGYSRSDTMIGLMKQVKKLYDPVSA